MISENVVVVLGVDKVILLIRGDALKEVEFVFFQGLGKGPLFDEFIKRGLMACRVKVELLGRIVNALSNFVERVLLLFFGVLLWVLLCINQLNEVIFTLGPLIRHQAVELFLRQCIDVLCDRSLCKGLGLFIQVELGLRGLE
jgi:hypothetical protein